jgi:hypothetical protein
MFAVVRKRMDDMNTAQNHEALTQARAQQGGAPPTGGGGPVNGA